MEFPFNIVKFLAILLWMQTLCRGDPYYAADPGDQLYVKLCETELKNATPPYYANQPYYVPASPYDSNYPPNYQSPNYDPNYPSNSYDTNSPYSDSSYPPVPQYDNSGYPPGPNYQDQSAYAEYYTPPEYETTNCTDYFPFSGYCVTSHSPFNFAYWGYPTGICYIYTSTDCSGSGDGGTNDYTLGFGQSPSFSTIPQNTYYSYKCFYRYSVPLTY